MALSNPLVEQEMFTLRDFYLLFYTSRFVDRFYKSRYVTRLNIMRALLIVQNKKRSFGKQGCNFLYTLNAICQTHANVTALYL